MTDRPIIFSAPMVRALLDGRKTQTRRIIKPQPDHVFENLVTGSLESMDHIIGVNANGHEQRKSIHLPIAKLDRLWVREHWKACAQMDGVPPRNLSRGEPVLYLADGTIREQGGMTLKPGRHRQGMHMPRWASRITLPVTNVRVQRLQEITSDDALAEGVHPDEQNWEPDGFYSGDMPTNLFGMLWESIHGPGSWDQNPWVAAYTVTVEKRNIDQ